MISENLLQDLKKMIAKKNPRQAAVIDESAYSEKAPEIMIQLWKSVGAAVWDDGSYQTIDPALYQSPVDFAFSGSPIDSKRAVPYILSAFGKLTVYHEDWGIINIDSVHSRNMLAEDPKIRRRQILPDIEVLSGFPVLDADAINFGLFTSAAKKLGMLRANEMFAFVPAIALGGNIKLDRIQKIFAPVQLDILCQSLPYKTFYVGGNRQAPQLVPL